MSIRLEGFDGIFRGHRCLVLGKEEEWLARMNILESESLYKGRSILVIHEPMRGASSSIGSSLFRKRWDCIFRVRDSFEAQMLATYVANAPKPLRILWIGTHEIPRVLVSKWERADVTVLGGSSTWLACEWDVIFFPLSATSKTIETTLGMRGTGMRQLAVNLGSHLSEIADQGAALVWTHIDETDSRGALYWYDPSEGQKNDKMPNEEIVKVLEEVIQSLKS